MSEYGNDEGEKVSLKTTSDAQGVLEPESGKISKQFILKWVIFLIVIIYFLIISYHAPILAGIGRYLIKSDNPIESDLAVCLAGGNIERGMATADLYKEGLVSRILITREERPDGYDLLDKAGITYPETVDLLKMLLQEAGVPDNVIMSSETQVNSTMSEAILVRKIAEEEQIKSIIIVTSPHHTRRSWFTFREVFKDSGIRLSMMPSKYSGFDPRNWWKKRKYVREVIIEYQKLIFYRIKYLI